VAPDGSTSFTIQFTPTIPPVIKSATVSILNNDADENPYDFEITGTATPGGQEGVWDTSKWDGAVWGA